MSRSAHAVLVDRDLVAGPLQPPRGLKSAARGSSVGEELPWPGKAALGTLDGNWGVSDGLSPACGRDAAPRPSPRQFLFAPRGGLAV